MRRLSVGCQGMFSGRWRCASHSSSLTCRSSIKQQLGSHLALELRMQSDNHLPDLGRDHRRKQLAVPCVLRHFQLSIEKCWSRTSIRRIVRRSAEGGSKRCSRKSDIWMTLHPRRSIVRRYRVHNRSSTRQQDFFRLLFLVVRSRPVRSSEPRDQCPLRHSELKRSSFAYLVPLHIFFWRGLMHMGGTASCRDVGTSCQAAKHGWRPVSFD